MESRRVVAQLTERLDRLEYGSGANPDTCHLSGTHRGFHLVHHSGIVYGIRQSLGEVDLTDGGEALQQRYSPMDFMVGETVGDIRARVDVLELFQGIQGGLLKKQQVLQNEMHREFQALRKEILGNEQTSQAGLLAGQQTVECMRSEAKALQENTLERGREFEAKLAALNREISSTGVRLAEELQQTRAVEHSHSRRWERLGRSWPIRVLL